MLERIRQTVLGDPEKIEKAGMQYYYYDKDFLKHLSGADFNFGIPGASLLGKLGPKEIALLGFVAAGLYVSRLPSAGAGDQVPQRPEPSPVPPLSLDGEPTFIPPAGVGFGSEPSSEGWDCQTITGPDGPTRNAFRAALQAGDPNRVEPGPYRVNEVVRDTLPTTSTEPPEYVHPGDSVCVQVK